MKRRWQLTMLKTTVTTTHKQKQSDTEHSMVFDTNLFQPRASQP